MGKKMVKSELAIIISNRLDMPKSDVQKVIDTFLEEIESHLFQGNRVVLTNFGQFDISTRARRTFFSGIAGRRVTLPLRVVPTFRFSTSLSKKMTKYFS